MPCDILDPVSHESTIIHRMNKAPINFHMIPVLLSDGKGYVSDGKP